MPPNETPVVPESPDVVKGGPLDPTSPEGTPPEAPPVPTAPDAPAPSSALYRGITGDINNIEDFKKYAQNLESLLVARNANTPGSVPAVPPTPPGPSSKDRFSELIYSKPEEAFQIAVDEAKNSMKADLEAERRKDQFWIRFYEKNTEFKKMTTIVQSVLTQRATEIASIRTEA